MVKTLLDAVICTVMNMDWTLQIGHFRTKAVRKRKLKLPLYPLISSLRAFTYATLELVELLLLEHWGRTPGCWSPCYGGEDRKSVV